MEKKAEPRTYAALVEAVQRAVPIVPKKVVALILDKFLAEVAQALVMGDSVRLRGLGTLRPKAQPERFMRHPQTHAEIHVPAKTKVVFRAGKRLKEQLETSA